MKFTEKFLCVITGIRSDPVSTAESALSAGAGMIQLRHKSATGSELYAWAVRIQELCSQYGSAFIVNDRIDIALAMHADGVHLGQNDLPASVARSLLGPATIIGVSVSNYAEAQRAADQGADYIGVGHIFLTVSKQKINPPIGLHTLREITARISLPVVAIGGIDEKNAEEVLRAGASGIAVISAVSDAENPLLAARRFVELIRRTP
jgi:thiamine-phosphate pyrophosphorylase